MHSPYIMDGGQESLEASTSRLPQHVSLALLRMDHQFAEGEIPKAVHAAFHHLPSSVQAAGHSSSEVLWGGRDTERMDSNVHENRMEQWRLKHMSLLPHISVTTAASRARGNVADKVAQNEHIPAELALLHSIPLSLTVLL